jgi:conjugal transfer/entry exclusion protein
VHETIIGKDNAMFKLERVQRSSQKIQPLFSRIPPLEKEVYSDSETAKKMKSTYGTLEIYVFEEKRDQTTELLRAMNELVKKIQTQQESLLAEATACKAKTQKVKPDTKEARARQ